MSSRSKFSGRKKRYIITAIIAAIAISIALYNAAQNYPYKNSKTWNFDSYQENSLPDEFVSLQIGSGRGTWIVKSDESAPSKPNVLAKLSSNNTESSYHMQIMPDVESTSDVKSSVQFKIISGEKERAAGLVFRFQDPNHYFVLAADAINNRFSLCRTEPERIVCTQDKNANVTTDQWHTIMAQVSAQGIAGYLDGKLLIQRYDQHYMSGKVGLWTKGDSKAYFDDLKMEY